MSSGNGIKKYTKFVFLAIINFRDFWPPQGGAQNGDFPCQLDIKYVTRMLPEKEDYCTLN